VNGDSSTGQSIEEDRYCGQTEYLRRRSYPGAGIQDREEKVLSLCGVKNNCSSASESPNKSLYQIRNPLITCRVTKIHATILINCE
jgi:hypothetical protein